MNDMDREVGSKRSETSASLEVGRKEIRASCLVARKGKGSLLETDESPH